MLGIVATETMIVTPCAHTTTMKSIRETGRIVKNVGNHLKQRCMYVWYGTNEYNFEMLPNPPSYKPTHCSKCGVVIKLGTDGHTCSGDEYWCEVCAAKEMDKMLRQTRR